MPCFSPISAHQLKDELGRPGAIIFKPPRSGQRVGRDLDLPCGQCVGCRLERSRQWAVRCVHEAQLHESNVFVTLTYSDEHLPPTGGLVYRDFQLFMKRLRKTQPGARFYMCGEYGEQFKRPHYHACLFGVDFLDKTPYGKSPSGEQLYRSATLEALWPLGFSSIGTVTFESAAYVARYVMKKVTGPLAQAAYTRIDGDTGELHQVSPEFTRMSLKPGIGADWLKKYQTDVYPGDAVIINGGHAKPPRYYDRKLGETNPDTLQSIQALRQRRAISQSEDNTAVRLETKRQVTLARLAFKKRNLE